MATESASTSRNLSAFTISFPALAASTCLRLQRPMRMLRASSWLMRSAAAEEEAGMGGDGLRLGIARAPGGRPPRYSESRHSATIGWSPALRGIGGVGASRGGSRKSPTPHGGNSHPSLRGWSLAWVTQRILGRISAGEYRLNCKAQTIPAEGP